MPHNSLLLVNKATHSVFSGVALARLSDNQTVFVLQTVSQELKRAADTKLGMTDC